MVFKKHILLIIILLLVLTLIFLAFFIIGIFLPESRTISSHNVNSLDELESIKLSGYSSETIIQQLGIVNSVKDKNKILLTSRHLGELDLTEFGNHVLYITNTTHYVDFLTLETIPKVNIQNNDMLIVNGILYKNGSYKYIDATEGEVKILKSSDYDNLEFKYFLGREKIENAMIMTNQGNYVTIRVYEEVNGIEIPFILTFKLSKNTLIENSLENNPIQYKKNIDIIFEKNLDEYCLEFNTGIAKEIIYK